MSSRSSRRNDSSSGQEGIQPRYRRAFGCVTWIYMATLAFLAVASLGMMPIWFFAGWGLFSVLEGITFYAYLDLHTVPDTRGRRGCPHLQIGPKRGHSQRRVAVGSRLVGWTGFVFPIWLENIIFGANLYYYWLAVPPVVVAGLLLTYAVFPGPT